MLRGILPIVFVPFTSTGDIDEAGLKRVVQFELEGGVHGLGVNGFATEAYKLTDDERRKTVEIVAHEVAGQVPLIIGIAPGSTEAAIRQAKEFASYDPAALMTLPPPTMDNGPEALVGHYVELGNASDVPIMVQQSPHIPAYSHCGLGAQYLAEMVAGSDAIRYFKLEGPGAPERMAQLSPLVDSATVALFGGGGGITFPDELAAGAAGVIPGVGFNEAFVEIWERVETGDMEAVKEKLQALQPLVSAVSGPGHEFSLHARKQLMKRAGYIGDAYVRRPSVEPSGAALSKLYEVADTFDLRISQGKEKVS